MKRADMIKEVAETFEVSQGKAKKMIETFELMIAKGLEEDGEVPFFDGKFKVAEVKAKPEKQGRNPKTGETMTIPAKEATRKVVFKAGKKLKERFI